VTKRSLGIVVLILFFGTLIGTLIGELLGWILPDSVVREFFLRSVEFSLNGLSADESGVISLDFVMFSIQFGLQLTFNFTSIIGLAIAYYFLRYFR
tara:strand:- start:4671 stop:4958 length:288 start_codon:yes stop_codon:yes gene_type:complete